MSIPDQATPVLAAGDSTAYGFLDKPPDTQRYANHTYVPWEAAGLIVELVGKNKRVLDVGCGSGVITILLKEMSGCEVIGLEPNPERAEAARQLGLTVHTRYLAKEMVAEFGTFDVVVFADVLEHLDSPGEMLSLAKQFLSPGGAIVASVPNVAHWSVRVNLALGKFDHTETGIMDATHLRWFTRKNFTNLFRAGGFEVADYRASAGAWLPQYDSLPFKALPGRVRERMVRSLAKRLPTVFGCQHVVRAVVKG